MKQIYYKISYWVFYALIAISAVIFLMFCFVGYDNMESLPSGFLRSPQYTDLLLYWMYFLVGVCILSTLVAALVQFALGLKDDPKKTLQSLLGLVLMVALLGVSYALADNTPIVKSDGQLCDQQWELLLTDTALYSQYVLIGVALVCALISLTGVVKVTNKVKK